MAFRTRLQATSQDISADVCSAEMHARLCLAPLAASGLSLASSSHVVKLVPSGRRRVFGSEPSLPVDGRVIAVIALPILLKRSYPLAEQQDRVAILWQRLLVKYFQKSAAGIVLEELL